MSDLADANGYAKYVAEAIGVVQPLGRFVAREFAPWHRPRKQYVRRYQWFDEMRDLVAAVAHGGGEFRYLTLPGQDMLDIRFLHDELFAPLDVKVRFLAFDQGAPRGSGEDITVNSSLHAVKHLSHVDFERSRLHSEALERVAQPASAAHVDLRSFGAFHAINIDLCDGVARLPAKTNNPTVFDALNVLLEAQSRTDHDCLILLTTRIDDVQVDGEIRAKLDTLVSANLEGCKTFATELNTRVLGNEGACTIADFQALAAEEQFVIGLLKWMLCRAVEYRLAFELRSVMTYKQNSQAIEDDLVSVAIKVGPHRVPAPDAAGIAVGVTSPSNHEQECAFAGKLPKVLSKKTNVDSLLEERPSILCECKNDTIRLLELASYDIEAYEAFLAG